MASTTAAPRRRRTPTPKTNGTNGKDAAPPFVISDQAVAESSVRPRRRAPLVFAAQTPAPNVVPRGHPTIAQDTSISDGWSWAQASLLYAWDEGLTFLGYPLLAAMAQRPEYRRISETIASEMTRMWIVLHNTGEDDKSDEIARLEDAMKRLEVQDVFRRIAEQDGFFGRAHLYIDTGDTDNPDELKSSIGNGRNRISQAKIGKGSLVAIRPVEAVWAYPNNYNSTDPLASDWYKPSTWFVMGKEIHASRLLTFVGREVPDLLKPAYQFGGLALSQIVKPYVDNWLRTRTAVGDLIYNFATTGIKTNLSVTLQRDGEAGLARRIDFFNNFRNNRGTLAIDKETEDFFTSSIPLGGLDALQAQSLEQICTACGLPLIKYTGLTPTGLNACLTGDTLIETDTGFIPIRDVCPGQQVMTREGLAPVAWAGCTGYATELVEITTNSGILRCTPDHKIWLPEINEFAAARSVRVGDSLLCRGVIEKNPYTVDRLHGGAGGGGSGKTATTPLRDQASFPRKEILYFTERFGGFITGLYRKAVTSTTSMAIPRTINSIISYCFQMLSTAACTVLIPALTRRSLTLAMSGSADIAVNGSFLTARTPNCAAANADLLIGTKIESHEPNRRRSAFASFVVFPSRQKERMRNTVRENAPSQARIGLAIWNAITESIPRNSVTSVRRVPANEFVYDIQVAKDYLPEFFANTICTHNSSEGEIRSFYDWISAYQNQLFREHLERVVDFIQLSELGYVDPCITFEFRSLWQLDDAGKASVQRTIADIHAIYEEMGVVSLDEVREAVAHDPDSPYSGIDLDEGAPGLLGMPELPGAPEPSGIPTAAASGSQARAGAARPGATGGQASAVRRARGGALPAGQTGGIAGRTTFGTQTDR